MCECVHERVCGHWLYVCVWREKDCERKKESRRRGESTSGGLMERYSGSRVSRGGGERERTRRTMLLFLFRWSEEAQHRDRRRRLCQPTPKFVECR